MSHPLLHLFILFPSVVASILTSFSSSCFHLFCFLLSPLLPSTYSLFLFLFASFFLSHLSHCLLVHIFFLSFSFLAFFPHTSSIVSYNRSISAFFFFSSISFPLSFSPLQLTHCFLSPLYFSICSFFLLSFSLRFPLYSPSAPCTQTLSATSSPFSRVIASWVSRVVGCKNCLAAPQGHVTSPLCRLR